MRLRLLHFAILFLLLSAQSTARAQDAFEIQVYDAETAAPGELGIEVHVNNFVAGTTAPSPDGELPTNHVTHVTLEPHVGLASWCELGAYLQGALRSDGHFDYAGFKLRFKARLPRRFAGELLGFALNVELSVIPDTYEAAVFGSELRPVLDLRWKRLYVSLNPILTTDIGGAAAGHPRFEPAAKLAMNFAERASLGVEYYAAFGALDNVVPLSEQSHRLFLVLDYSRKLGDHFEFDMNLGVGANTVGTGDRWIIKSIFGFSG